MKILVTGGAGYIGSHVVKHLIENNSGDIVIIDNLVTGFYSTVETLKGLSPRVEFINADLSDWKKISEITEEQKFDAVIHFAASLIVPESVKDPLKYYLNNTANTANLIRCCVSSGVKRFIFSSTAAVYGEPENSASSAVSELSPLNPVSPYGRSKMFSEFVIKDTAAANPSFKYVILRYFNVAGADKDLLIGQSTADATHLIKIASQAATGKRTEMFIYGNDYDTPDGTCLRDYIHVDDLASAHTRALDYLQDGASDVFNCGYGYGFSVREVVDMVKKVSGVDFNTFDCDRRAGDPAVVVSDCSKIKRVIGWKPKYNDLAYICKTALEWERRLGIKEN